MNLKTEKDDLFDILLKDGEIIKLVQKLGLQKKQLLG